MKSWLSPLSGIGTLLCAVAPRDADGTRNPEVCKAGRTAGPGRASAVPSWRGGTHGSERQENDVPDDPLRPLGPHRGAQGRPHLRGYRELRRRGLVRAAPRGGRRQDRLRRPRPDQGDESVRAERPGQGAAGAGLHLLQARREEGRHDLGRALPPGQDRRADPGQHPGLHRVLARVDGGDGRSLDLRRQGGRGRSRQDDRRAPRRRDPVDEGPGRQGLLRRVAQRSRPRSQWAATFAASAASLSIAAANFLMVPATLSSFFFAAAASLFASLSASAAASYSGSASSTTLSTNTWSWPAI